jgi:2-keto-4-pentenoate hydratase/2-oxohepta-3-ene-1,7-dioic acid hydratase in catechol pathway
LKLVRFDVGQGPTPGLLSGDHVIDLRKPGAVVGFSSILEIVAGGLRAIERLGNIQKDAVPSHRLTEVRLLAPIERPGKYLAIGMNYKKHLEEAERLGMPAPKQQLWFNKQTSCLAGPYDDIELGVTDKLDYEVELGVVIGRPAKHVSSAQARAHIFGYFVANDVSARDWQFHSPTFTVGKSFDTHGPIGPWIVTADEIADPHALGLRCFVNQKPRQSNSTRQMIYNVYEQISYLSTAFTLESGDLLATGTPEGVGVGMTPPTFLQPGDVVRCEIDGIGAIENKVVSQRS